MSDAALSTDIPGDSWQKVHAAARGVTAQDPGKALTRLAAYNAEVRRRAEAKKKAEEAKRKQAEAKKAKGGE